MISYSRFLYDEVGDAYKRKNLYLQEIAELNDKIKKIDPNSKKQLKLELNESIKRRKTHPYNIELNKFKDKEKTFLKSLKIKKKDCVNTLDKSLPYKARKLKIQLFIAQEKYEFYKDYVELTYDAQLEYEKSKLLKEELSKIIDYIVDETLAIKRAIEDGKNIDLNNERKVKLQIKEFEKEQKEYLRQEKRRLKEKRRKRLISKKAQINEIKILKQKYKESVTLKSYDSHLKANKEFVKSKKHEIKENTKLNLKILNSNIADIYRTNPIEVEKSKAKIAYFTLLFPGVGQMFNGQYKKGCIFLLATLFIYLIGIPYALGFGNYQGEGIRGLVTLAEGGRRIDKSLIFMIEGIIAIFFVFISLFILYFSF